MTKNAKSCLAFLILFTAGITGCTSMTSRPKETGVFERDIKDESLITSENNSAPRKRVLVLPFLDESETRPHTLSEKAEMAFLLELNRSGQLLGFDSSMMKMDYSKFINNKQYKLPDMVKQASGLGLNALIEGKIVDVRIKRKGDNIGIVRNLRTEFEIVAQVRVFNLRRGKEVFNTIKTVTVEDANVRVAERVEADRFIESNAGLVSVLVKDAFLDFVPQVLSSLDQVEWQGRIAAINGDRIYLNVGRASGLMVGDLLKVMEDGDDVYDPENGAHIGKVQGRLKGTLEVISYFGTDGAIAKIHSGGGFRENDRVEMY